MMSFKLISAICFLLFLCLPAFGAVDTLHLAAELDTLKKQVVGLMSYRLPDHPDLSSFEFQLVPNMYASDKSPYLESRPELVNFFKQSGEWGNLTIDSAFLDDADITAQLNIAYTRGTYRPDNSQQLNGRTIRLYFTTRIPRLGERLSYFGEEYLLDGWFPFPAVLRDDGSWDNSEYGRFAELVGPFLQYDLQLTVPSGMIVAAPVPPVERQERNRSIRYRYHFGPAHDFAVALSPHYLIDTTRFGNTTVHFYYHSEEQPILPEVKVAAESAFVYMSNRVGNYTYTHLNYAFTATAMIGGVEFPGMISLYSPRGGAMLSRLYEFMVVHETVHQWFYGMVASDQVREPWMDETVTNFFTDRIFTHHWGDDNNLLEIAGFEMSSNDYLRLMARPMDRQGKINRPAASFYSNVEFNGVIYNRGALALKTFDNLLGDSLSQWFWREYAQRNHLRRVSEDDFINLAEEIGGASRRQVLLTLLNGTEQVDYGVGELVNRRADSINAEISFMLSRTGKLDITVPYQVVLYNDDTLHHTWTPTLHAERITIIAPAPAREVVIDPDHLIAVDTDLMNNSVLAGADSRPGLRLSSGVMFLIESLLSAVGGW